jgi:signal transduction histidine kinase
LGSGLQKIACYFAFPESTRRRKAGSTGLGLSIVQRIAELHSATITLENRRPAGARFSLKFIPLRP